MGMRFDQLQFDFDRALGRLPDRHRVVLAYDTPSARRRRKFARTALSYAERVQQSVYEADLTETQLKLLTRTLAGLASDEDDIRLYPQCARCAAMRLWIGKARPPSELLLVVA
jgi:CRISPR-associated protein Cas2